MAEYYYDVDQSQETLQELEDEVKKQEQQFKATKKAVKRNARMARRWRALSSVSYVLMVLFTLFFMGTKIVFGGVYAGDYHDAVMIALLVAAGVLVLLFISFFVFFRIHRRTGRHWIRWLLIAMTVALCYLSVLILGAYAYLIIVFVLLAGSLAQDIPLLSYLSEGAEKRSKYFPIISCIMAILIGGCTVLSFGLLPADGKDAYVEMGPLKRNVRYDEWLDEVRLEKVMLTVFDALEIEVMDKFEVQSEVKLDQENVPVSVIGEDAFKCVRSFSEVVLPKGIVRIEKGAFENSKIKTLTIASADGLVFKDGLSSSAIERIVIKSSEPAELKLGWNATMKSDIAILVPKESIDGYRQKNPEIADQFVPDIEENEVYVNFNISAPKGSGDIENYLPTQIVEKDENGKAKIVLPYADLTDKTEKHGEHWLYKQNDKIYRLFYFVVGDEKVGSKEAYLSTENSLNVYGEWVRIHTVNANFSSIGGGKVLIGELYEEDAAFVLPTNVKNNLKVGYTCNEWYLDRALTQKVEMVTDYTQDLTVYPKWTLDKPVFDESITLCDYDYESLTRVEDLDTMVTYIDRPFVYDSCEYRVEVSGEHAFDGVQLSYLWKKDGQVLSNSSALTLKNVSDSGTYTVELTAKDKGGNTATAVKEIRLAVVPTTLSVFAEEKNSVYGEATETLTYTFDGLYEGDAIFGELTKEMGENAGEYAILQGSLDAGENYVISYTGATYTIEKADYNMSGVTYQDGSLVYNGERQNVQIIGALPVGLDGITLTVSYSGGAKDVAEGAVLSTAIFATESENYNVPEAMTAMTTITPKTVVVTAEKKNIVYGEENVSLTFTAEGIVDGQMPLGALIREIGNEAGEYAIQLGTLSYGENYAIAYTGATYTIEKRTLTVSAENKTVVYGESEVPLTYSVSGVLDKDNSVVQVVASLKRESGNDVGVYAITFENVEINGSESYQAETVNGRYEIVRAKSVIDVSGIESASYTYTGLPQTIESGATLNHSEATLMYANNVFTTVAEGNALMITVSVPQTKNYEAKSVTAKITVDKAEASISTEGIVKTYEYTGETQAIASGAVLNHGETQLVYLNNTFKDVPTGGSLTVSITAVETENYNSASATVTVTVNKAKVAVPNVKTGLIYTGEEQIGVGASDLYSVQDGSAVNAGSYTAIVTLKQPQNYEWATPFAGTLSWSIEKATVSVPEQDRSFEHTGDTIVGVAETEFYTVTNGSAAEVNAYEATVILRDSDNYRWADESFNGIVRWSIVDTDGLS